MPFQGVNSYTFVSILKRMFRMGMSRANEKMLNIADSRFSMTDPVRYFLYGAANRLRTFQNAFIFS